MPNASETRGEKAADKLNGMAQSANDAVTSGEDTMSSTVE